MDFLYNRDILDFISVKRLRPIMIIIYTVFYKLVCLVAIIRIKYVYLYVTIKIGSTFSKDKESYLNSGYTTIIFTILFIKHCVINVLTRERPSVTTVALGSEYDAELLDFSK